MSMQGLENLEDTLISIIKSIKKEMKDDIMKKKIKASTANIGNETSSSTSSEVGHCDEQTLTLRFLSSTQGKLSPGSFLLLFNINNHSLYAITTLDAKDNIIPLNVYEYLGLDEFRGASIVENTTGTNEPLGTIDILAKFRTLEFLCNLVIKMVVDVIILGRPFLESTHTLIDVFNEEILFEIGREKIKFNINSHQCVKKIYMVDTGQEEETFDLLKIGMDLFSYESPASLKLEQRTRSYGTPNLHDEIAEPISFCKQTEEVLVKEIAYKAVPLGHVNGARFKAMIRKELEGHKIQKLRGNSRDRLDSYSFGNLAEFAAVTA
ncbi:phospholipase-like protein [Tanacetum coccineum]